LGRRRVSIGRKRRSRTKGEDGDETGGRGRKGEREE
jgi:hypothetical protein